MTNFDRRLAVRKREMERLYMELYDDRAMLDALERAMAGFPILSSGDEIAQLNGYDYRNDPARREDSRNVHRTAFNWDDAAKRTRPCTMQPPDAIRRLYFKKC